jgi:hypothetical protein
LAFGKSLPSHRGEGCGGSGENSLISPRNDGRDTQHNEPEYPFILLPALSLLPAFLRALV